MRPVRSGDRGPAVEDIQRRLLALGHDLGPTGVDGVFLGRTEDAVRVFQADAGLAADGVVEQATWSALVDATFTLGDRMLYLRTPLLHGRDVRTLQGALNVLGFGCGGPDGLFGAFTECAVREFQMSTGLTADGIAGPETVRAVTGLRHVWEGKDPTAPAALTLASARAGEALARRATAIVPSGAAAADVATRVVNLALAAEPASVMRVARVRGKARDDEIVVRLVTDRHEAPGGVPVVAAAGGTGGLAARVVTALSNASREPAEIAVDLSGLDLCGEREMQRAAVEVLDALCAALV
ncbi:MAG: peptidoglycan-binding protein [Actinobacteria bacterium]|nr:MAG: peptidoglycan-binding protein [Actinomycetota bacterium]